MKNSTLSKALIAKYDDEVEHVGYIMPNGKIIEVENVCDNPAEGFDVSGADIIKYALKAKASWHTHPKSTSNLSTQDLETFLSWPDLEHYVVGNDGVTKYVVKDGDLVVA